MFVYLFCLKTKEFLINTKQNQQFHNNWIDIRSNV